MRCLQKAKDGAPALARLGNEDEISKVITKDKDYNFVEEFNRQLRLRRWDGLHRIHAAGRGRQKPWLWRLDASQSIEIEIVILRDCFRE